MKEELSRMINTDSPELEVFRQDYIGGLIIHK